VRRIAAAIAVAGAPLLTACGLFATHAAPFTPDEAPVTETIVSAADTTYALRAGSYWLLSSRRSALWERTGVDDVAWRYKWLFGTEPPAIAIRLDTMPTPPRPGAPAAQAPNVRAMAGGAPGDSIRRWRGMPMIVAHVLRPAAETEDGDDDERPFMSDAVAAPAARLWLWATAAAATRGGLTPNAAANDVPAATSRGPRFPAWFEAAALVTLTSPGAREDLTARLRSNVKDAVPLTTLFTTTWPEGVAALDITLGGPAFVRGDGGGRMMARGARGKPGANAEFIAQSASVLAFLRQRDPTFVAPLAIELARGRTVAELLPSSTALPHDVTALDAEWRRWVKKKS
jgi:hypothetical protein